MNPRVEWFLRRPAYQRALMILAVMLLVVAAFVFLLYLPKDEEYSSLQQESEKVLAKLQEDRRIAANLPRFKAEYEKMKLQLDQALTELPNEKEIPSLLTTIATLAKENGLNVLRFKPGGERPQGFYAEVPVDLKLVGTFHQIAKFFYDVGDLPRIVNIGKVAMTLGRGGASAGAELSVDCLAVTFRFLEGSAPAAPAKKGGNK
ncbi:type 4a pilus biogenesis protein PilO [Desulfuromonas carbonis]|uniref:type 4a pilus biogenesis protein PilO n=1 Tax=Desulfuromonas sp. DDH964 TaxID=1823759 RepID=UPI00078D7C67|nr:type 4a pilus biogenesis protein PilO [Desulfuromonas sp. DDH964]AMV71819.1 type IV pilus biogenesis protein PilO [Desulfuromonas sp. DDH964]